MAVTKADKVAELEQLERAFKGTESAVVVDFKGLKVPEVTELRRQIRGAKGSYKVVKNTLARRAMKGTAFEALGEHFLGTTAVAYSGQDPVALAKVLTTFAKTAPALKIKAGKVEFRVDKTGIVHAPVGKISFPSQNLIENTHALVDSVVKAKPSAAKGKFLRSVTMSSTMGPGIVIDTTHVTEVVKH